MLLRRMGKEPLGGSYITPFAQKKRNAYSLWVRPHTQYKREQRRSNLQAQDTR
jgi:hypothetical protein